MPLAGEATHAPLLTISIPPGGQPQGPLCNHLKHSPLLLVLPPLPLFSFCGRFPFQKHSSLTAGMKPPQGVLYEVSRRPLVGSCSEKGPGRNFLCMRRSSAHHPPLGSLSQSGNASRQGGKEAWRPEAQGIVFGTLQWPCESGAFIMERWSLRR